MIQPKIIRSSRSSISISISPQGEVVVKAPHLVPSFLIKQFISKKQDWIEKHLQKLEEKKARSKKYINGEEFWYLGKIYKLHIGNYKEITLTDTLNFPNFLIFRAKKELTSWYLKQAKEKITQRVSYHASQIGTQYKSLLFSDTKSKWGTCGPENDLQFNWRLIMTPLMVVDYVVIHELVHTLEKNHSGKFWRKVGLHTPAFRQHKKWLNQNAHLLTF